MIKIKLKCQFDNFLLNIDEELPSDKIIGLFGKSGCGKSRLLRQILGFDSRFQNQSNAQSIVKFKSSYWQDKSKNRFELCENRGIGYLPQTIDLFPYLNVEDNIGFNNKANFEVRIEKKYSYILQNLGIQDLLKMFPNQLSGGQKQRVGLARALIAAKNLLILDEPMSAIGEDHKPQIMKLLRFFNKEHNLSIIYSSHNRYEHAFLTDHLITMNNGLIEQSGKYSKISTDISQRFAQVPDSINHIKAKVIQFDDNFSVNQLETKLHQLWAGYQELNTGRNVNLEIRAKDISVSLNHINETSILNCLAVTLVASKEIAQHQYLLKLAFEEVYLIAFITKKSYIELKLKNGMSLFALFKAVSVLPISD